MTWSDVHGAMKRVAIERRLSCQGSMYEDGGKRAQAESLLHELCHLRLLRLKDDRRGAIAATIDKMCDVDADYHEVATIAAEVAVIRGLGLSVDDGRIAAFAMEQARAFGRKRDMRRAIRAASGTKMVRSCAARILREVRKAGRRR